jgi:hypothetical protein
VSLESEIEERLRQAVEKLEEQDALLDYLGRRAGAFSEQVTTHFAGSSVTTSNGPVDKAMLESMEVLGDAVRTNRDRIAEAIECIREVIN